MGLHKGLCSSLIVVLGILVSSLTHAQSCSSDVKFENATDDEIKVTCLAYSQVEDYFQSAGLQIHPHVTYVFADKVEVKIGNESYPVYGYFDSDTQEIHFVHLKASTDFDFLNQKWGLALASSFIAHETTHLFVASYMGVKVKQLPRAWHEAVAYAVQFELMNVDLKQSILNGNTSISAFEDVSSLNETIYEMDPAIFALKSYLSIKTWGASKFVGLLMNGKVTGISQD